MLPYHTPNTRSYTAGGDLSAKQFHFVKVGTVVGTVVICGASDKPIGIVQNAPLSGEAADVAIIGGGAKLAIAGTVTPGAFLKPDSNGKGVATAVSGDFFCAVADSIGSNGASGDNIPVLICGPAYVAALDQAAVVAAHGEPAPVAAALTTPAVVATVLTDLSTAGGNTYTDAAVNAIFAEVETALDLKTDNADLTTMETELEAALLLKADSADLITVAAKLDEVIAALKTSGLMASA